MANEMRHSPPPQQRGHESGENTSGRHQQPAASKKGSKRKTLHRLHRAPSNSDIPAHQKVQRRFGVATLCAAGLVVVVVSGGVGAAMAFAVQAHESAVSITAAAATAVQQPTTNLTAGSIEQVAAAVVPSVVQLETDRGNQSEQGSGIVLTADGLVMTNAHVVAAEVAGPDDLGGARAVMSWADGRTAPFSVVGSDPTDDIAVVRAQGVSGLTPITLGSSSNLRVGEQVVAVGCPLGLDGTVTSGIISALHRPVYTVDSTNHATALDTVQTDAPINPGNSGGALVDMKGHLIGMTSAIMTLSDWPAAQSGSIGLGFAIPVDHAKRIADGLIANGG